jgi:hypothetical protein
MLRAGQNAVGQLRDGLRLVAGGRVIGDEVEHRRKVGSGAGTSTRRAAAPGYRRNNINLYALNAYNVT